MDKQDGLLKEAEELAKHMSLYQHDLAPDLTANGQRSAEAKEILVQECEVVWREMEECQRKLSLLEPEALLDSDVQLSVLMARVKALMAEHNQWQNRKPDVLCTNPEVLVTLGKEEIQKVNKELEMVVSCVLMKNKKIREDLEREQKWLAEQQELVKALAERHQALKTDVVQLSEKRALQELGGKIQKIKVYQEELLIALGTFLEDHYPLPKQWGNASKKKKTQVDEPCLYLITLHEILENLINKLMISPHDPYITIDDSYWPPYIEFLLRYGIALRHPEDPHRIRLEAFHQ
ncbi:centromere protein K [Latimeria chalumnae]|uniref:Centromere protein K n=1 Tax=Latimeria chalumnae TaxID=7897 RepID=H3B0M1_LATCH|nr:PREDICTED: centromere protein K [Latimeria chalumnae]|eukprot:XP_005997501.1 PREDICTED: centromere protein K [Latimeria chalumnae]